jgi:N-acetyltransferase
MTFTPSNALDVALHKKYHAQNLSKGIELSRRFVETVQAEDRVWSGSAGDVIVSIIRSASSLKRKGAEAVISIVEEELGAVGIDTTRVWSEIELQSGKKAGSEEDQGEMTRGDRYKAFLYIRGAKCIGFCLAERISFANEVLDTNTTASLPKHPAHPTQKLTNSSSITVSTTTLPATLGISRIWTATSARREGIAASLLDSARKNFLYGMRIKKTKVAFSQPTESGGKLARRWFGRESGWLVYSA